MAAKKHRKIKHVQENYDWEDGTAAGHEILLFSYATTKGKQASKCALVSVERCVTAGALRMFLC